METHAFGFRLRANAPEGQKRFPISYQSAKPDLPENAPRTYVKQTVDARRLSLDFGFRTGSSQLDNKALRVNGLKIRKPERDPKTVAA
jgi:hypothetical protein